MGLLLSALFWDLEEEAKGLESGEAWPLFRFPLQGTRPAKGNPPSAEEVDAYLHCFLKSQGKGLLQVDMGFS